MIFYCQHGNRTDDEAERLGQIVDGKALLLGGGIEAWKQAGLPIVGDPLYGGAPGPRLCLHAATLDLSAAWPGEAPVTADLPAALRTALA